MFVNYYAITHLETNNVSISSDKHFHAPLSQNVVIFGEG